MNPHIQGSAYQFFIEEIPELLQIMETGILTIRHERTTAKVHEIMRAAHSIKGGAASVNLEGIKEIAHGLEDYLKALYSEEVIIDEELESLLLQGYDTLRLPLLEAIDNEPIDEEQALATAKPIFAQIEAKLGPALSSIDDYIPSSSDLGIDIVDSIFQVDVAEIISTLDSWSINPPPNLEAELQSQIEIFAGFGELLNLPGVTEIAQTATAALQLNPEHITTIIRYFRHDVNASRDQILTGDRISGGEVSPSLKALSQTKQQPMVNNSYHQNVNIHDESYQFFIEEAYELLETIENGILSLKEEKSTKKVHEIVRAAHSIKGGAAMVNLNTIREIAYSLENYFKALHRDDVVIDTELEDLLLQGYDCLRRPIQEQIETGNHDVEEAIAGVKPIFAQIEAKLGSALTNIDDYVPSSQDLGIDIASSIFEVDVAELIESVKQLKYDTSNSNRKAELEEKIEIYSSFGELLDLPGVRAIAHGAIKALGTNPDKIDQIIEAFSENVSSSRRQILEGDRASGGEVSAALAALGEKVTQNKTNVDNSNQSYQFFIEEAEELLIIMENGILSLKEDKSTNRIHEIMRAAHSIKGNAASVNLEEIKEIAHNLEDYFKALYSESVVIDEEMESLLLQGYDCLRIPLSEQIATGSYNPELALRQAESVFKEIESKLGNALQETENYIPSSQDLGIDMVASIFEVDVQEELTRLEAIIDRPQDYEVAGEARALIDVFAGFGELLNLPGFASIANVALEALSKNPEQVLTICELMLQDFTKSRNQVLGGDRTSGGTPSPELVYLSQENIATNEDLDKTTRETHPSVEDIFNEEQDESSSLLLEDILTEYEENHIATSSLEYILAADGTAEQEEEITSDFQYLEESETTSHTPDIQQLFVEGEDTRDLEEPEKTTMTPYFEELFAEREDTRDLEEPEKTTMTPYFEELFGEGNTNATSRENIRDLEEPEKTTMTPYFEELFGETDTPFTAGENSRNLEKLEKTTLTPNFEELFGETDTPFTAGENNRNLEKLEKTTLTPNFEELFGETDTPLTAGENSRNLEKLEKTTLTSNFEELFGETYTPFTTTEDNFDSANEIEESLEESLEELEKTINTANFEELFGETYTPSITPEENFDLTPELEDLVTSDIPTLNNKLNRESQATTAEDLIALEESLEELEKTINTANFEELFGEVDTQSTTTEDTPDLIPNEEDSVTASDIPTLNNKLNRELQATTDLEKTTHILNFEELFADTDIPSTTAKPEEISELLSNTDATEKNSEENAENLSQADSPAVDEVDHVIQSIENIYESLPTETLVTLDTQLLPKYLTDKPKTEVSKPAKSTFKPNQTSKKPVTPNLSVRIDLNRIERINNLVGELSINRNSLSLQNEQLQRTVRDLMARFSRFQEMNKQLREVLDQLVTNPLAQYNQVSKYNYVASEFDTLEMDNYSDMHNMLQELLEQSLQLEESVEDISLFSRQSNQSIEEQRQMLTRVRDELMWARMLPLSEVLNRFPRTLRDLSSKYKKPVKLKLSGTGVLVDKAALEKLYDPLIHLLRNAFDHGIESSEIRKELGKPEEGTIEIKAYHQGNQTIIEITDDGYGINHQKIGQKAIEKQLLSKEQLLVTSSDKLVDLIFEPGFSTADQISDLSGRGVGLDVVRAQIAALKGSIAVKTKQGKGTTFVLSLPLTLTISKLLVCSIGKTVLALPSDGIDEIIVPQSEQVKISGNHRFLQIDNQIIPAFRTEDLLEYNCSFNDHVNIPALTRVPIPEDWALPFLIIRRGQKQYALEVNRLLTEQELVIKAFGEVMTPPTYVYGCTILGDGSLIPVINPSLLIEDRVETDSSSTIVTMASKSPLNFVKDNNLIGVKTEVILAVDDSAAMRRTLSLTLEKAGYRVISAKDGREAVSKLQQNSEVDLIICDIEMPNMNGFEFLTQRRTNAEMFKIPTAMLTSRSNDKHRRLAMQLGADAYFTKPYIEQEFLESIKKIISRKTATVAGESK